VGGGGGVEGAWGRVFGKEEEMTAADG